MHRPAGSSASGLATAGLDAGCDAQVWVTLLGITVTVTAMVDLGEHRRRAAAGIGAVADPMLLDRLLDLPIGVPITDPTVWMELVDQPAGVISRGGGMAVIRWLESPLEITDVAVEGVAGRETQAVWHASLFAGFARQWVSLSTARASHAVRAEAERYGVGLVGPGGQVLRPADAGGLADVDVWSWLLEEKTYRNWLIQRRRGGAAPRAVGR